MPETRSPSRHLTGRAAEEKARKKKQGRLIQTRLVWSGCRCRTTQKETPMSSPDREEEHKEKKKQQIQYDETNAGAAAVDLGFGTRRSTLRWTESPCRPEPLPCAILRVLTLAVTRSFAFGTSVPPLEQFPKSLLVPLKTRPSRVAELRVNATPVRCFFFFISPFASLRCCPGRFFFILVPLLILSASYSFDDQLCARGRCRPGTRRQCACSRPPFWTSRARREADNFPFTPFFRPYRRLLLVVDSVRPQPHNEREKTRRNQMNADRSRILATAADNDL